MGRWYLVRHGETDWNREGRIQGHSDVPLSDHGRSQVALLSQRLARLSFAAAYASDLFRAVESTQILIGSREIPVRTEPDLREFDYGLWEGLTVKQAEEENPRIFAELIGSGADGFATPEGETTGLLIERVRRFCNRLNESNDDAQNLLVVAHAGSIRALALCLLDLREEDFWRLGADPASLSIITGRHGGRVLELWNDTSHLSPNASG